MTQSDTQGEIQLLRSLFDLMPQLGWTALPDGYIDFYNSGWYEYTGTDFESQQGWGWEVCHDPGLLPDVKQWYQTAVESKKPTTMRFPLRRHDGVFRWFLTRMSPIVDADGNVIRWIGINTDIQDERELHQVLERRVRERTDQLQRALDDSLVANKIKGQFVSTISHEVRTPMAGVIGLAELLTLRELDDESKVIANAVFDASKKLLHILNDMLDFSKFESGAMTAEYTKFSLADLCGEIVTLFQIEASKKSLSLITDIEKALPEQICGDELRLRQVLTNLVSNALKFTSAGAVTIKANIVSQDTDKMLVKFSVSDTGIGITKEQQQKLFQPFTQADNSISRKYGGSGLGLSISKNFVELMGGTVSVESEIDSGSIFSFTVPFPLGEASPCKA